jgi:lipopolysaccharide O-acetyltransferase
MEPALFVHLALGRLRGVLYTLLLSRRFRSVGKNLKFFGRHWIRVDGNLRVGDNCWIQAVDCYKGVAYQPRLEIGRNLACSDGVHISCAHHVSIGHDVLIGSQVYIGDHAHGSTSPDAAELALAPAERPLGGIRPVHIGDRVWIGDGAVVLPGAWIASGSIVGANAVVKSRFTEASVIAGVPGRAVRELPRATV